MASNSSVLINADLPLSLFIRGKVRDTYTLGDLLLIVATDRISAFDSVLPCGIPDKGSVLTQLYAFWYKKTESLIPNHLVEAVDDVRCLDSYLPAGSRFPYPSYHRRSRRLPATRISIRNPIHAGSWVRSSSSR